MSDLYPGYPRRYPACIMCGARATQPCTVISGMGGPGDEPGDWRQYPHAARAKPGQTGPVEPFIPVKDEPNHYAPCDDLACQFHHPRGES